MAEDPVSIEQARAALGSHLAALRAAAGYTQATFARLTFYGRSSIANIETGRQVATRDFWTLCDQLLSSGSLLTAEHDRLIDLRSKHSLAFQPASGLVTALPEHQDTGLSGDELLTHLARVAAACGLGPNTLGRGRRRIGQTDITRLLAVTDLYRSVDRERGGGTLRQNLADVAESATLWLDPELAIVDPPNEQRLASAVAGVRLMAGWTAFDAGYYEDSHRHFVLAERAAVKAHDPLLTARVRYCQTRQLQHRHHNVDALHTVQFARTELGTSATPAVLAMLLGAEAASLAALGRSNDARRRLDEASTAFASINLHHEPTWMHFYDHGELCAQYGRVYRDFARKHDMGRRPGVPKPDPQYGAQAVHWVEQALAGFSTDSIRSSILNRIGLVSALMLAHAPDEAVTAGYELSALVGTVASHRVAERVRNLPRDFGSYARRPAVAEFTSTVISPPRTMT
ncbi:helix-turn-helix domain-containing protein [Catellatospora bangladeshensis]|uniref:XRE family transcriptional regulator n=1 Tax=Catellatospora bangladeshensis TaxID=310355 RepID=A0A8J3NN85_9ACTN|nr:helix-turn-helix transcriptional regulator [Catellatospora bangladeshensis]GIF86036.1 XRE family transcriptional regulator [Catellatospora bangladeshensis]